jgi:protein-S-isoprenylcysteine O-methyltransferase Ste14
MASGALLMVIYLSVFAVSHSFLSGIRAKSLARNYLGTVADRWYRLAFVLVSLLEMLPVAYLLIYLPGRVLYQVPPPWSYLMVTGQALAAICVLAALMQTGALSFLGIPQVSGKQPLIGKSPGQPERLVTDGFYCHLRNPLFAFGTAFIWLSPLMTTTFLALCIMVTVYFYLGSRHEEKLLLAQFGSEYEEYRAKVPAFLPQLRC